MATIYPSGNNKSSAILHTENVALFARPPVNAAEEKIMWVVHEPTFISKEHYSSVQFYIPGTGTQYTDLSKTELYVRIKITAEDGSVFEQTDAASALPVDQILHSMWGSVDIKLNQKLVSTSGTNYMYKALIENLLNYNHNCKKFQMSSIGFTTESGSFTQTHPRKTPVNYGLKERGDWFKKVTTIPGNTTDPTCVEFMGPLMADICNQDRYILNGVDTDIKLWPNRDEFRLITFPNGTVAKLVIEEIKLLVCKVKLSPVTVLAHAAVLQENNALYPYQKTDIRSKFLAQGSYGETLEDIYQGRVPSRLIVGFVESESYNGAFNKNPFHFQNFNLSKIGFYVDGESVPRHPLEFDFNSCQYLEGLLSLYRVTGKINENTDIGITRNSYREGYNLIAFEVDPTTSPDFRYLGQGQEGRTRLEIKFKEALPKGVNIILYATFPETIEIDESGVVRVDDSDEDNIPSKKRSKRHR